MADSFTLSNLFEMIGEVSKPCLWSLAMVDIGALAGPRHEVKLSFL